MTIAGLSGRALIAHELTHVIQQRQAVVSACRCMS
ncbi:MAG TPA: DUF4157 domain-containing protein [Nannocystis exedens]|nr:DUF4157 domain-containing protein [Nannocystis exedens]